MQGQSAQGVWPFTERLLESMAGKHQRAALVSWAGYNTTSGKPTQTSRQAGRLTNGQTGGHAGGQADRQLAVRCTKRACCSQTWGVVKNMRRCSHSLLRLSEPLPISFTASSCTTCTAAAAEAEPVFAMLMCSTHHTASHRLCCHWCCCQVINTLSGAAAPTKRVRHSA